jgi:signal transduction histidine kinase/ActR/RegA family two-component response regulator
MPDRSPRRRAVCHTFSSAGAGLVAVMGGLVLIGWWLRVPVLQSGLPGLATVKPNTAVCLLGCGASLQLFLSSSTHTSRMAGRLIAACVFVIAAATLSEDLFGVDFSIDQLLFREGAGSPGVTHLGRMAPGTALSFILAGAALWCLHGRRAQWTQYVAIPIAIVALVGVVGYAFGVNSLYALRSFSWMALPTALAFCVLSASLMMAIPDQGFMAIIVSDTAGGFAGRRLLGLVPVALFAIAWTTLTGERAGYYDGRFGLALMTVLTTLFAAAILLWHAGVLRRVDLNRQERTVELERRTMQLSRLASDLTLAEQRAREQLAGTLHDGLQQLLVAATLNLDQLKRKEHSSADSAKLLVQAKAHVDEAIAAARSLRVELFPPVLHSSGLPAALTWLAKHMRNEYGLLVQLSADPIANSERKDVRILLFESVRELLFNAVKHAKVDRVAMDLVLDQANGICITVADEGVGFDPSGLADRASTAHVGWGLVSIRERLTLLGGRFEVESAPGHGARFRLVAPPSATTGAIDPRALVSHFAAGLAPAAASGEPGRPLRILIADDHGAVLKVYREILEERAQLRVVGGASDGLEAITQAHALQPDVVLMDVSMPRMDGVEATQRLRAELPFIQILGLSTQPRSEGLTAIERAGAAGFFTKGVDTQRLIDELLAIHAATTVGLPGKPA